MKKQLLLLFSGWITVTVGLFLAVLVGRFSKEQFSISGDSQLIVQAVVMSGIVVPITLYLYQKLFKITGVPKTTVYSLKRVQHVITGMFLAIVLALIGILIADIFGWIKIQEWYSPEYWGSALLLNAIIAFFYEALPEELVLRGFVFDVLLHRINAWLTVIIQTLVFLAFSIGVSTLQVIIGIAPIESIFNIPHLVLLFFFGLALAFIRLWTGSLWASIGFHLAYLELARFLIMPLEYGVPPIMIFQDTIMRGVGASFIITVMILGANFALLLLIIIKNLRGKYRT